MEFFIRKNATLPYLEVDIIKDGRFDYNFKMTSLSSSTVTFSMKNVDNDIYKVANGVCVYSVENNSIYYQFTKKNTSIIGRYEGEFKINNSQGSNILPLRDKLFVNVIDSFVDPDFCCAAGKIPPNIGPTPPPTPTPTVTPTPTPTPTTGPSSPGIWYGKFNATTITSGQVVSNLTFETRTPVVDTYINVNQGVGYTYILIPTTQTPPSGFVQSTNGCDGVIVPMNNIGNVVINDNNGFPVTYDIYRTFFAPIGELNIWMCS